MLFVHKERNFKKDCPEKKRWPKQSRNSNGGEVSIAENSYGYDTSDMLVMYNSMHENEWILD